MEHIFVADIGGTNTRLAIFQTGLESQNILDSICYETASIPSFSNFVSLGKKYLADTGVSPKVCVLAVAGPVICGSCRPPNIPWIIERDELIKASFASRTYLINDFLAQAYSCLNIKEEEFEVISERKADFEPTAPRAVLGVGTGFGKALLLETSAGHIALPSEGGHGLFCAEDREEFALMSFLKEKKGLNQVCWEDVLSGSGLCLLHEFLTGEYRDINNLAHNIKKEEETVFTFSKILARACRCFVLDTMSINSMFLTGGVLVKIPELVRHPIFIQTFVSNLKQSILLEGLRILLLKQEDRGLRGAALYGVNLLGNA